MYVCAHVLNLVARIWPFVFWPFFSGRSFLAGLLLAVLLAWLSKSAYSERHLSHLPNVIPSCPPQYSPLHLPFSHHFSPVQFVIESRDSDTETRRVAPVLLSNSGVTDVMTGCADHGWCFGYTCQKRLSTFWTSVGANRAYELNFTGAAFSLFHLLNTYGSRPRFLTCPLVVKALLGSTSNDGFQFVRFDVEESSWEKCFSTGVEGSTPLSTHECQVMLRLGLRSRTGMLLRTCYLPIQMLLVLFFCIAIT
jgi:hypothetical protein